MATEWTVESFHIDVNVGDCAIHLLTYNDYRAGTRTVHSAVLIDGGSKSKNKLLIDTDKFGLDAITPVVDWIESQAEYRFAIPDANGLQFESVVVTHWDEDHYGGIVKSLQAALATSGNSRVPWLKYGSNNAPLTVFYCPNSSNGTNLNGIPIKFLDVIEINKELYIRVASPLGWTTFAVFRTAFIDRDNVKNKLSVLGVNFFGGGRLPDPTKTTAPVTPAALLQLNPPEVAGSVGRPGMYCIGVWRQSLTEALEDNNTSGAALPLRGMSVRGEPGIGNEGGDNDDVGIVRENPTMTNQVSIAAAILWPQTNPIRCSHYFAGDADQESERLFFKWMALGSGSSAGVKHITSMKISHHGSRSSTPWQVFDNFMPQNLILSTPNGRYFHPSWELLLCGALHVRRSFQNNMTVFPAVIALKYPFFFTQYSNKSYPVVGKRMFTTKSFETADEWITWMRKVFADFPLVASATNRSYYDEYITKEHGKAQLIETLRAAWQSYCWPDPDRTHNTSFGSAGGQMAESKRFVEFVVVISRNSDSHDGLVFYKAYGEPTCKPCRVFTSTAAATSTTNNQARPIVNPTPTVLANDSIAQAEDGAMDIELLGGPVNNDEEVTDAWFEPGENIDEQDSTLLNQSQGQQFSDSHQPIVRQRPIIPAPITPATAMTPSATSAAWANWYICASTVTPTITPPNFANLTAGTDWNWFVQILHTSVLALQANPNLQQPPSEILLDNYDELANWMADCVNGSRFRMINGGQGSPQSGINGFRFDVALPVTTPAVRKLLGEPGLKPGVRAGDSGVSLPFSSEQQYLDAAFPNTSTPPLGLRKGGTALMFAFAGLASSTSASASSGEVTGAATASLADLATFAGVGDIFNSSSSQPFLKALGLLAFTVPQQAGNRNVLWFMPQMGYKTVLRLQFDIDPGELALLNSIFKPLGTFNITSAYAISRRSGVWRSSAAGIQVATRGSVVLRCDFNFTPPGGGTELFFDATVEVEAGSVILTLTLDKTTTAAPGVGEPSILESFLAWVCADNGPLSGVSADFPFVHYLADVPTKMSFKPDFALRRIRFHFAQDVTDAASTELSFVSFELQLELGLTMPNNSTKVFFLVTYTYTRNLAAAAATAAAAAETGTVLTQALAASTTTGTGSTLEADLWTAPPMDPTAPELALLPDHESYDFLEPLDTSFKQWPAYVDLTSIDDLKDMPEIFPSALTEAKLYISNEVMTFSGTLKTKPVPPGAPVPQVEINEIYMDCTYRIKLGPGQSRFAVAAGTSVLVQPPPSTEYAQLGPAEITGSITYDSSIWTLTLSVDNLYAAYIFQFFDTDLQSAVATLLGKIELVDLEVVYSYTSGKPSKFALTADLKIGDFTLDLKYNYYSKIDWRFTATATLKTNQDVKATLGDIITYVTGIQDLDLPDAVKGVPISIDTADDNLGVTLRPSPDGTCVVFVVYLNIGDFAVQYVSFSYSASAAPALQGTTKRMFLASVAPMDVDRLPNIPLVGSIPQPFDELLFMWVQGSSTPSGLTFAEVSLLNDTFKDIQTLEKIQLKPIPYQIVTPKPLPADVVIAADKHLVLVLRDLQGQPQIVMDYRFGAESASSPPQLTLTSELGQLADDPAPANPDSSGMAPYSKSFGPLQVRNLGLKFSTNVLAIKLDASITIGPLVFSVYGFTLSLDFSSSSDGTNDGKKHSDTVSTGNSWSIHNLPTPEVTISGLELQYDKSPVDMDGMLKLINDPSEKGFEGALTIGYTPWLFQAAGCYLQLADFKTAFVYCQLDGPLMTLEFAEISGITGGFGYNSNLTLPVAADVPTFPFLNVGSGPAPSPVKAQSDLFGTKWFTARDGTKWFAVGLKVTAFEMLDVEAVVVADFGPSVKLGIYAIATLTVPKDDPSPFAEVQLAMAATLDVGAGTLNIDGQLTPSSYILDPSCHLTGGFALYSWFTPADTIQGPDPDSSLRGSWVFTLGGYHRQFTAPPQFPQPPRLAIAWDMGIVALRGEAYFAITPSVVMGGGRWDVTMNAGPLSAWYEFWADFLINFKPFHFIASGGLDVGVAFTLDLWIVTIHIRVDIGADISIAGPPVHGTVHVDFWVFGFDIDFGDDGSGADALTLSKFLDLACQQKSSSSMNKGLQGSDTKTTIDGKLSTPRVTELSDDHDEEKEAQLPQNPPPRVMHVLTVEEGLVPNGSTRSTPSGGMWTVRAAPFTFRVDTKVPIQSATINTMDVNNNIEATTHANGTGQPIGARPMCTEGLTLQSTITINIKPNNTSLLRAGKTDQAQPWRVAGTICKDMPNGLWGPYFANSDPSQHANDSTLLNGTANATTNLLCGIKISQPLPTASDDTLKMFDIRRFTVKEVNPPEVFPALAKQQTPFEPLPPQDGDVNITQWDVVHTAWTVPGQGHTAASATVKVWKTLALDLLGWDINKMNKTLGPDLTGDLPTKLVGDLHDYYPWAPVLSGAMNYDQTAIVAQTSILYSFFPSQVKQHHSITADVSGSML